MWTRLDTTQIKDSCRSSVYSRINNYNKRKKTIEDEFMSILINKPQHSIRQQQPKAAQGIGHFWPNAPVQQGSKHWSQCSSQSTQWPEDPGDDAFLVLLPVLRHKGGEARHHKCSRDGVQTKANVKLGDSLARTNDSKARYNQQQPPEDSNWEDKTSYIISPHCCLLFMSLWDSPDKPSLQYSHYYSNK